MHLEVDKRILFILQIEQLKLFCGRHDFLLGEDACKELVNGLDNPFTTLLQVFDLLLKLLRAEMLLIVVALLEHASRIP